MAAEANMRATELCTIEATVPTGFEEVAREEAVENFGTECRAARGKIHDCLSRLQLLVKNVNWAEGLAVWKDFFTFHLPVQSCPEKIPTDEELIDVCIMTRKPQPKKKQQKGQGKERRKGGKGQGFGKNRGKQKYALTPQEQAQEPPGNVEELEAISHKACMDAGLNNSSDGKEGSDNIAQNGEDSTETKKVLNVLA
ncbi:hypothetical protein C0Q70_15001 [Pomacea canaliculata]|uniref:Uncharacterized protein n=1 Tax=Pomacea canaliculata TaxID=400727 RepID=A0A2T7NTL5_POMCA|nr:hypothetical protein C0Q70_15001 [Pomacea canaliculata]